MGDGFRISPACDPEAGECGGCDAATFRLWGCACVACHGSKARDSRELGVPR